MVIKAMIETQLSAINELLAIERKAFKKSKRPKYWEQWRQAIEGLAKVILNLVDLAYDLKDKYEQDPFVLAAPYKYFFNINGIAELSQKLRELAKEAKDKIKDDNPPEVNEYYSHHAEALEWLADSLLQALKIELDKAEAKSDGRDTPADAPQS